MLSTRPISVLGTLDIAFLPSSTLDPWLVITSSQFIFDMLHFNKSTSFYTGVLPVFLPASSDCDAYTLNTNCLKLELP